MLCESKDLCTNSVVTFVVSLQFHHLYHLYKFVVLMFVVRPLCGYLYIVWFVALVVDWLKFRDRNVKTSSPGGRLNIPKSKFELIEVVVRYIEQQSLRPAHDQGL